MKIIFCTSYLTVRETISLIDSIETDFIIVTSQEPLFKFFVKIYDSSKVKCLAPLPKLRSLAPINVCRYLIEIYRFKRKHLPFFADLKNCDVWFFFVAFCSNESFFIKELSRSNRIYYKPAVEITHLNKKISLKSLIGFLVIRMIYGVYLVPKTDGKTIYFSVDSIFLRSVNALRGDIKTASNCGKEIIKKHFGKYVYNKKILLLLGGVIENNLVRLAEYERKVDELIGYLQDRYNIASICIKTHPRYPKRYSLELKLDEIPCYVPANLIIQFYDIVISYESAALFETANGRKMAISLLNYFEPISTEIANQYKEYLINNCTNQIYFPQTMDDIIEILARF